jgi:hypothetical protein
MRAYEIISENDQLNEVVPVIAGLSFGAVMAGLTAYFAVTSAYEVWKILEKNNYEPDKMSDDDWTDIAWEILPLAIPVAGKYIGKATKLMLPKAITSKLGQLVKGKMSSITGGFKKTGTAAKAVGGSVLKKAAAVGGAGYAAVKTAGDLATRATTGDIGTPAAQKYQANRQAGQAFGSQAGPGTNWDSLGTMSTLNKKYGK